MGQRSGAGSSRGSGRGYGVQHRQKAKAKKAKHKHESSARYEGEISPTTAQEAAEETVNKLRKLGGQVFAVYPFSEYFDIWLRNVREVLSEFESNSVIKSDEQFSRDSQQILSDVESRLDERRRIEKSRIGVAEELSEKKQISDRLEKDFSDKEREAEAQGREEIKHLSSVISDLKEKMDEVERLKTGIFRGFSEKAKAHRMAEVKQELDSAKRELDLAEHNSDDARRKLKEDYETEKTPVLERMNLLEKELEEEETDGSLQNRDDACEALIKAVNALLERSNPVRD